MPPELFRVSLARRRREASYRSICALIKPAISITHSFRKYVGNQRIIRPRSRMRAHQQKSRGTLCILCDRFEEAVRAEAIIIPSEAMILQYNAPRGTQAAALAKQRIKGSKTIRADEEDGESVGPVALIESRDALENIDECVWRETRRWWTKARFPRRRMPYPVMARQVVGLQFDTSAATITAKSFFIQLAAHSTYFDAIIDVYKAVSGMGGVEASNGAAIETGSRIEHQPR